MQFIKLTNNLGQHAALRVNRESTQSPDLPLKG